MLSSSGWNLSWRPLLGLIAAQCCMQFWTLSSPAGEMWRGTEGDLSWRWPVMKVTCHVALPSILASKPLHKRHSSCVHPCVIYLTIGQILFKHFLHARVSVSSGNGKACAENSGQQDSRPGSVLPGSMTLASQWSVFDGTMSHDYAFPVKLFPGVPGLENLCRHTQPQAL